MFLSVNCACLGTNKATFMGVSISLAAVAVKSLGSLKVGYNCTTVLVLRLDREEALRRDEGNVFQIVGAWYEKGLCPWDLVLTFGITRSFSELDLRERDG